MAKKGLGKGLSGIIGKETVLSIEQSESIEELKLSSVMPNQAQPRKQFDDEKLNQLAESIKENGIIQPIIVTKTDYGYKIVAGERRWRAAKLAGLDKIPAIIRDYTPKTITQVALLENLQREDLNPIEIANAYKNLMDEYDFTQEEISEKIGKSRSSIANSLRLLNLEDEIANSLITGEISEGHARAILSVEDSDVRKVLLDKIIDESLNVRQAERLAKIIKEGKKAKTVKKQNPAELIQLEIIRKNLEDRLCTKVSIKQGHKKGKIEIEYYGNEDLDRLISLLK